LKIEPSGLAGSRCRPIGRFIERPGGDHNPGSVAKVWMPSETASNTGFATGQIFP
jgi:hypothetical protein